MKHRQVEAFHALIISGSTVRAAEIMGITQPAVSRLIAELEHSVRFPLFDRVRGRLVPTPEARLFFREVEESFRGMDRLRAAAAGIRDYGEGTLRIGGLAAGSVALIPSAIRLFRESHPKIRITFHVKSSADIRNGIVDGQYDIGLAADEIDKAGVDTQTFASSPGVVAMPMDHPLASKETIKPEHLSDLPLLGLVPEDRARQRLDTLLAQHNVVPDYIVETPNSATICALAESGNAVGLINPMVIDSAHPNRVAFRPFRPSVIFRSLLIFPVEKQKSKLVREFTKTLMALR
ncbi:LysR family transcriptional regulator [Salipiger aestuarii]|uniref:DNA-binding transcriptional LysR family regulator n=1 Tax=Salipiger aestuarii TaxID=568098 RepID=A0A327XR52_9RHOB|nr:LysR substrate-binding domain-containing protein [Salipiger aestuarii]EIE53047.1 LysR family transcriptional regulator [Citreicella sp. 357]KAA8606852.1 LysR family transcriptional regulator [Salipiger aestuarii]KAA8607987.1 LysR family transcriptional regulator [Salipiger aestuarii]KAB2536221.1 LysR family transcriptional regulator [Salipiger aestuarii]RAK10641.1 DNA-binding transcriptional LysR family regulator [Salipiger aestuarii]